MKPRSATAGLTEKAVSNFHFDVAEIRRNAREHLDDGAVTDNYGANKEAVIKLLGAALATEWICVLRYTQHQISAAGIHAEPVASHFAAHAAQEQGHALELATRIKQLGGTPSLDPANMSAASHAEYRECDSLGAMIKENLVAERIAIHSYTEMIRSIGDADPTTKRMLEGILATEEEHADELASLLVEFDQAPGGRQHGVASPGEQICQT